MDLDEPLPSCGVLAQHAIDFRDLRRDLDALLAEHVEGLSGCGRAAFVDDLASRLEVEAEKLAVRRRKDAHPSLAQATASFLVTESWAGRGRQADRHVDGDRGSHAARFVPLNKLVDIIEQVQARFCNAAGAADRHGSDPAGAAAIEAHAQDGSRCDLGDFDLLHANDLTSPQSLEPSV